MAQQGGRGDITAKEYIGYLIVAACLLVGCIWVGSYALAVFPLTIVGMATWGRNQTLKRQEHRQRHLDE